MCTRNHIDKDYDLLRWDLKFTYHDIDTEPDCSPLEIPLWFLFRYNLLGLVLEVTINQPIYWLKITSIQIIIS